MAVVSQPFDRGAKIPLPGKLDKSLDEFWVENPWYIEAEGHNLSAFERKRAYLNVADPDGGRNFLDISYLTGADGDGDGRSIVAADFRNNGQLDLVLRQVGGGPIFIYENHFPQRHYLQVSLRGHRDPEARVTSNRFGIGARLEATVKGRKIIRDMYPANSFQSQVPTIVHFGLADDTVVDQLTIRWPSGKVQIIKNLAADRHVLIDETGEGNAAVKTITSGEVIQR